MIGALALGVVFAVGLAVAAASQGRRDRAAAVREAERRANFEQFLARVRVASRR